MELALKSLPDKTQEQVAEQVGCTQEYVGRIKRQFRTSSELPAAPATVTGKDGKTYPTSKPRKAKTVSTETPAARLADDGYAPTPALTDKERRELQQHREQAFNAARSAPDAITLPEIVPIVCDALAWPWRALTAICLTTISVMFWRPGVTR